MKLLTIALALSVSAAPLETDHCTYGGMSVEGLGGTDIDTSLFKTTRFL